MWHKSRTAAVLDGLKQIGRAVDPEALERAAREAGIKLPVTGAHVHAPSFNDGLAGGYGFRVEPARLTELAGIVDTLLSGKGVR